MQSYEMHNLCNFLLSFTCLKTQEPCQGKKVGDIIKSWDHNSQSCQFIISTVLVFNSGEAEYTCLIDYNFWDISVKSVWQKPAIRGRRLVDLWFGSLTNMDWVIVWLVLIIYISYIHSGYWSECRFVAQFLRSYLVDKPALKCLESNPIQPSSSGVATMQHHGKETHALIP